VALWVDEAHAGVERARGGGVTSNDCLMRVNAHVYTTIATGFVSLATPRPAPPGTRSSETGRENETGRNLL